MSYALYLDPSERDIPWEKFPPERPKLAYWRLVDLTDAQLAEFDPNIYPPAPYVTAEIHPAQWDQLRFPVDRVSVVLEKSGFQNLNNIRSKLEAFDADITFNWDHRFHISYYQKMLQYWIYCGVNHFSFYDLQRLPVWQQLKEYLARENYHFYDRYHACKPGHESRYQKHLAHFGNLFAIGGFSRWTLEDGHTRTRASGDPEWHVLSAEDAEVERLLFAMADVEGIPVSSVSPEAVQKACDSGLGVVKNDRLCPTDAGLWDTVGLVSQLR